MKKAEFFRLCDASEPGVHMGIDTGRFPHAVYLSGSWRAFTRHTLYEPHYRGVPIPQWAAKLDAAQRKYERWLREWKAAKEGGE